MITHLLDTSVYSQRLRPRPVDTVMRRWSDLGDSRLSISVVCEAEVLYGLEKKASERFWAEYDHFLKNRVAVLPLSRPVIETFARVKAELQGKGVVVGEFDLLIGATALAEGLRLATLNTRDFSKIPGLPVEDWSR